MLYTSMCNRFQQQHFSLKAPSASIASTKAVVMGLSLTCPLLCTPRLFPNQRWVPWPPPLFLHRQEHTRWFTACNNEQMISQVNPAVTGGGFCLLCEVTVAYMLKSNANRKFVSANSALGCLQIHLSAILVEDIAHAVSAKIL